MHTKEAELSKQLHTMESGSLSSSPGMHKMSSEDALWQHQEKYSGSSLKTGLTEKSLVLIYIH